MARFKYLGEPQRGSIVNYGPAKIIRLPKKNGTYMEMTPIPPLTAFPIGQDIGYDITEERALRIIRADTTRFEEIA